MRTEMEEKVFTGVEEYKFFVTQLVTKIVTSQASKKNDAATFWQDCHKSLLSASLVKVGIQTIASSLHAPEKWHKTQNPRLNMKVFNLGFTGRENGASISF